MVEGGLKSTGGVIGTPQNVVAEREMALEKELSHHVHVAYSLEVNIPRWCVCGGLAPIALLEAGGAKGYVEGEYYKMWHPVFVLF